MPFLLLNSPAVLDNFRTFTCNMKKKILLTDVDGVLFDWVGAFGVFAQSKGYKLKMKTPTTWDMNEWFGADNSTIKALIKEFNSGADFANLPIFSDAKDVIPKLANRYDLVAISCCSKDPKTVSLREKNLNLLGVKFKEIHCLDFTESKADLLASYSPTIWLEDRPEGAETGHKAGHKSFLRNTTYNTSFYHPEITRINCLRELYLTLKKVKN